MNTINSDLFFINKKRALNGCGDSFGVFELKLT